MQYNINLKAIAAEAFGYSRIGGYQMPPAQQRELAVAVPIQPDSYEAEGVGLLGLPVFTRLGLKYQNKSIDLLDVILTVERPVNIVTTSVQGGKAEVNEFIGNGNFAVVVQGILASDPHGPDRFKYPFDKVQEFNNVVYQGQSLEANCRHLTLHGIKNLVIKNIKFNPIQGFINLQGYELQCLSDEPYELLLK